jgi:predicted ATPase
MDIRMGVNRGHLFAGDVGAPFRRTYSTMGDATNLAARIMGKAPMGGLLAHRSVLERTPLTFDAEPVPPFMVKGKTQAVDAAIVHGWAEDSMAAVQTELPMIGRDAELQQLQTAARASEHRSTVVEIVGDAGSGKTRLVNELLLQRPEDRVVLLDSDPYDRTSPFAAVRRLLRNVLDIPSTTAVSNTGSLLQDRLREKASDLLPSWGLLGQLLGAVVPDEVLADIAPQFLGARTRSAVASVLDRVLGHAIVVFDDATNMDDASAGLLAEIFRGLHRRPWLVIIVRREDATGLRPELGFEARRINLPPLGAEAMRELLAAACAEHPLSQRARAAITARAAGNPMFALELAVSGESTLPSSVEAMLATRIDRLSIKDKVALRNAAVIGVRFGAALLDGTLGVDGITSRDAGLWSRLSSFVSTDGTNFLFRSDLIRDVAYEGLTYAARTIIHERVATFLARHEEDRPGLPALLSLHFFEAGRHREALGHSLEAGSRASRLGAHAEAAALYLRALRCAETVADVPTFERARIAELVGDEEELACRYDAAARAFDLARRRLGPDDPAVPRLLRKSGIVREREGAYAPALRWYGRALTATDLLDDTDGRRALRARISVDYAGVRFRQGRLRDCVQWARRAVEDAESTHSKAELGNAYYLLNAALTHLGDQDAENYEALALPMFEEIGDLLGQANVLNNLGVNAYYEGRWEDALVLYERSRVARERVGDEVGAATAANNIAEILSDQGKLTRAETLFLDAQAVWRASGYPVGVAVATGNLGRAAARTGRLDEGLRRLRKALDLFLKIGADALALETELRIAEVLLGIGRSVEAWESSTHALNDQHCDALLAVTAHRLRASAMLQTGGVDRGLGILHDALQQGRSLTALYEVALCLELLAQHETSDRPERRAEAAAIFARLGVAAPAQKIASGAPTPAGDVVTDDREREARHASPT